MKHTTIEERGAIRDAIAALLRDRSDEAQVRATMETETGHDPALWRELAAMGVVGLIVDPEFGGAGLGPVELELVAEAMGAALLCSPFLSSSVLAAGLLAASGDRAAQAAHLPGIAAGTTLATAALTSARGDWTPAGVAVSATGAGGTAALSGVADYVTHGQVADLLLVAARTDGEIALFALPADAPGVSVAPLPTFDRTLRLARIAFRDAPATRVGAPGWASIQAALDLVLVAMAGEQAGGARRVFDMTVDYARDRIQFGRPIGSFQAIKHMAADRLLDVETAISAARDAAEALAEGGARAGEAVPLAAFACAEAYGRVAADAIQMHGGIAFTWAHPAHLYLRRARATAQLFGPSPLHRERFLSAIGG
ncbi:acyl-CoA/acyl-ACP dehydrogenase [Albimonas sp. CAU 1670]|uniref:acyl-CoA dehydrogenase family protein n=1 Tax=Albimonas sp. CAU 1670 TaxID=3032599 RepID=UPI0023DC9100|nr:acyl-CoA dehydrogenase family protein [Albimonas sp. CAU 1670]MDF2235323.1 acyl-CoA/acyl-ACP dehydrogenase [Albimonas sp. CAU 1670]